MLCDVSGRMAKASVVDGLIVDQHLALDAHFRDTLQSSCQEIHLQFAWFCMLVSEQSTRVVCTQSGSSLDSISLGTNCCA